ncbi:MAG: HNH endonuclease [Acidimicrobiia bacterium]
MSGSTAFAARTAMDAVQAVRDVPETKSALLAGEVSLAQAAAIASAPGHERELLALARSKSLGPVKDAARRHRLAAIDPEQLHDHQVDAQYVRTWKTELGNIAFQGELPPEVVVPFVARLDAETDRCWRAAGRAARHRTREWHAARAFARLVSGTGGGKATAADVVIVCDINAYRRGRAELGEPCHIVGAGPIPVAVAQELARDAFLKAVLHDGVNIHTVAHFGRHRPAALRTALELGAPPAFEGVTCTDCGRRYHLEWDHIHPCANGGVTSYANVKPRCPPCHDAKTERDRQAGLLRGRPKERAP